MKIMGRAIKEVTTYLRIILSIAGLTASAAHASEQQVPFGDSVSAQIKNYHRHQPTIATSGRLAPGALVELKQHGFKTVLDLRTADEGVKNEANAAALSGLAYYNIPVGKMWPEDSVFLRFKALVEDPENHPMLIHCASANRVGLVWAEYQIRNGLEYDAAVLEGRTIGLTPGRELQLLKHHNSTE